MIEPEEYDDQHPGAPPHAIVSRVGVSRSRASMRSVLFVQGGGDGVHDRWDNRLVESLRDSLGSGYRIRYPEMPNEADPAYSAWSRALQAELAALTDGAILVGHSIGAAVLLHTIAEDSLGFAPGAICTIAAPFIGPGGWESDEIVPPADLAARLPSDVPILLYHGDADVTVPVSHVELYARAIPRARVRRLAGRDHQLDDRLSEVAADIRALMEGLTTG